jgi:hypothetical protein
MARWRDMPPGIVGLRGLPDGSAMRQSREEMRGPAKGM